VILVENLKYAKVRESAGETAAKGESQTCSLGRAS
jgi:hypothetical protein